MARKKQTSKKPNKATSKAQAQKGVSNSNPEPINQNIEPGQDETLYKLLDAKI